MARYVAKKPPTTVLVTGANRLPPTAQNAAIAAAFKREARRVDPTKAAETFPPLTTEREVAANIWARVEGGDLIITVPLEAALAINPPDERGHVVIAKCGSSFGAHPLQHDDLRLTMYLAKGSAPKRVNGVR